MTLKQIFFIILFIPLTIFSQNITNISPNQGSQGQSIPLIISGNNMNFSGWSCWSNTGSLSEFRFSQWSGINMIYGFSTNSSTQQLDGVLNIPAFQSTGVYNLEVYDCAGAGWVMFPNSFQINSPSWDCVGGACIDPGTGNGIYSTLSACQSNCVLATWDCIGGACIDPANGQGIFASLAACQANCVITPSWDCISGACIDPGTGNGTYSTLSACQSNCVTPTWDCIGGACVDPGTGQGTYASLAACQSNCVVATWDCIGGTCIDPGTGQGIYASLSACQSNCNNSSVENIGARRLHTIIEKVLDDISFNATDRSGETITIDEKYVKDNLGNLVKDTDLSKFIL